MHTEEPRHFINLDLNGMLPPAMLDSETVRFYLGDEIIQMLTTELPPLNSVVAVADSDQVAVEGNITVSMTIDGKIQNMPFQPLSPNR